MPKKEYVKRDITYVGRTQDTADDKKCEVCVEGDEFLQSATKHDNRITYKKIEVDTPEGQKIAEDKQIDGIPFIRDCKTFEKDGKPRCREITGFEKEEDWSDLQDLVEKASTPVPAPTVEPVETPKKTETEKHIVEEPSEPVEPVAS